MLTAGDVGAVSIGGVVRTLVVGLGLLISAVLAQASPVGAVFIGYGLGVWQNGYPYSAYIDGYGATPIMCDDYMHGGAPGQAWAANVTNLGTAALGLTRFNQLPDSLTLYREAGWLLLQTKITPILQWRGINYAEWHIFDPNSPLDASGQYWLSAAQAEAAQNFPGVNFNLVDILTPVSQYDPDPNSMQEFLFLANGWGPTARVPPRISGGGRDDLSSDPAQTPEPGTLLLVATGALGLLGRKLTR